MERLKADPESGIMEVMDSEGAKKRGGFPEAAYVLISDKGYEIRDDVDGEYCRTRLTQKAQHGYNEEFPEMRASFMLTGKGIVPGSLEQVCLIDVAPTLADIMGGGITGGRRKKRTEIGKGSWKKQSICLNRWQIFFGATGFYQLFWDWVFFIPC